MARTLVVDEAEGTRFPFLRGILTRSLQEAGVPFEAAYKLATAIRDDLREVEEITTDELQARVLLALESYGPEVLTSYLRPARPATVLIRYTDGHTSPFSRGRHRLGLASCGISGEEATVISARIFDDMLAQGLAEIDSTALRHLTYRHLVDDLGDRAAQQYLVWQEFKRSNRPLVIVIGGGVGSGKSTIAAQVAHRLEIVRIQSTDMLREVMRVMVPSRLLPMLHKSSFNAWEELATPEDKKDHSESALVSGYLTQAELVSVACEAVLQRAMRERVSVILEGVHAHPGLLPILEKETDAIVVRVMLGVLKPRRLRSRIKGRGKKEPDRRAKRYLEHFDDIWSLQSFMLSEADQLQVPIVENEDLDDTVLQVMGIIMKTLASEYSGTPEEIFWNMAPTHKALLVILDGLGDRPAPALEGRTPLEAARTPNMDRLVAAGLCGLVDPLQPGTPVDTQTGTGVLLGLLPEDIGRLSRGPVEAAGVGLTLRPGDVALRCNFATVAPHGAGYEVLDRRAGRIREGTDALAEAVNALEQADGLRATLVPAAQHRAVLRLSGPGLSAEISDSDPGTAVGSPPLLACYARHAGDPGAVRTAGMLNSFLHRVVAALDDHPVNEARRARGEPPANAILTRGAGVALPMHNLLGHLDVSAAVVAGDRTALGLASLSGFARITQPGFTCLPDTDLDGKVAAARKALERYDFVCLHIKATDVLSHDRDPAGKRDFLERVDAALGPLFTQDLVVGIAADHTTNSLTGRHTGDPVPSLLSSPDGRRDSCTAFGEGECMRGGLGRVRAADYLRSLLDAAGAIGAYTPADEHLL